MLRTSFRNLASGHTGATSLSNGTGKKCTSPRSSLSFKGSSYTTAEPLSSFITSSRGFMATRKSISLRRPMYPCLLTRMVNHVGNPAMFDGNMFFPETGMPIWKMARIRTVLAVWLPLPFTVAT